MTRFGPFRVKRPYGILPPIEETDAGALIRIAVFGAAWLAANTPTFGQSDGAGNLSLGLNEADERRATERSSLGERGLATAAARQHAHRHRRDDDEDAGSDAHPPRARHQAHPVGDHPPP